MKKLSLVVLLLLAVSATAQNTVLFEASNGYAEGDGPSTWVGLQSTFTNWGYGIELNEASNVADLDLSDVAIIVLSVTWLADSGYDVFEIEALVDFVAAGGNLLVLGDHPGMNNLYLNSVIGSFGISCGNSTVDSPTLLESSHPVLAGHGQVPMTLGGSLQLSGGAEIVGRDAASNVMMAGYVQSNAGKVLVYGDVMLNNTNFDATWEGVTASMLHWFDELPVAVEPHSLTSVKALFQ